MECTFEANKKNCICTYEPCNKKGKCCECVAYHRANAELPGCFFPSNIEKTYNRSIGCFMETYSK